MSGPVMGLAESLRSMRNWVAATVSSVSDRKSAWGQFRTWAAGGPMSGLTPRADPY